MVKNVANSMNIIVAGLDGQAIAGTAVLVVVEVAIVVDVFVLQQSIDDLCERMSQNIRFLPSTSSLLTCAQLVVLCLVHHRGRRILLVADHREQLQAIDLVVVIVVVGSVSIVNIKVLVILLVF